MVPWNLTAGRGSIGSVELKTEGHGTKGSPSMYISPGWTGLWLLWGECCVRRALVSRVVARTVLEREDLGLRCLEQLEQVSEEAADKLQ